MAEHEFKGDTSKMTQKDYVSYHPFTHDHKGHMGKSYTSNGDVAFVAEIICVHSFEHENLDVFHPLYDAVPTQTITRAFVSHTECQTPTEHSFIEGNNFADLVNKWIDSLDSTVRMEVRRIVYENYAFLQMLE